MKDLDAASMSDVQDWFKTYYGPNNVTLVIAGDITPEIAREKVEKYFGDIPPARRSQSSEVGWRSAPARIADRCRIAFRKRVSIASGTCPHSVRRTSPLLDLVAQVLGRGKTSRLYKRLVYKDQIATGVTARTIRTKSAGNSI